MENWRHFKTLNEHGQKKSDDGHRDAAQAVSRWWGNKTSERAREEVTRVIEVSKFIFLRSWEHGYKRTQAIKMMMEHNQQAGSRGVIDLTVKEAEHIYDKRILPVIQRYIQSLSIKYDKNMCVSKWADFGGSDTFIRFCTEFYDSPAMFKSEKDRDEALRTTTYHELAHAIDYLWSTHKIQYPGKPEGQKQEGFDFSSGLSINQRKEIQKLFHSVLSFHKKDKQVSKDKKAADQGGGEEWKYKTDLTEIFANIQEIVLSRGRFELEDVKLICAWKQAVEAAEHITASALRQKLRDRNWTDELLEKNNFIKDFECRAEYLNQDSVNILNKVTNVDLKQIQRMSMTAEE